MKLKEAGEVLAIPEKIDFMKYLNLRNILIIFVAGALFACSGAKRSAQSERDEGGLSGEKSGAVIDEQAVPLEEKRAMEFEYLFLEALKEKALGNPQRAVQLLSGCLEIDPGSSAAMFELASIHSKNNDFTSASLLLEKAISINPDNHWYQLMLAQVYQQSRRFGDAAGIYDKLLKQDPENLEYLFMKAALYANSGKVDEAINAYNDLEQQIGINEQISIAKQQLYMEDGKVEKAFEEIQKLIEQNPEEPRYYGLLADFYQQQGDSENALKYYRKIQEIDPGNGFVHFSLANYFMKSGDLEQSFNETKRGFESEEVELQTKLQLYLMLTAQEGPNRISQAREEELIDILIQTHTGEYLVHTVRAESLIKKGKLEEARAALFDALSIEKNDYILWERVFFIDNDLQEWDNLYKHTSEAMEFFPNQAQIYFFNALSCLQLQKYDEMLSIADEGLLYVVENKELEGQFVMLKGEALYKTGKVDEAFKLFDAAVELNPKNHIALNNYAYYLSLAGKDLDKAERMSGKVIELFPENATYLDTYAWVLFRKGEFKLARFYMESAMKFSPEPSGTLFEHFGDILFMLGQTEEALEYWKKAKDSGEESSLLDRKIREKKYFEE